MKIIIEQGKRKRLLEGPFRICGSREDLEMLIRCLQTEVQSFTYGWIDIVQLPPPPEPNTEPEPWEERR